MTPRYFRTTFAFTAAGALLVACGSSDPADVPPPATSVTAPTSDAAAPTASAAPATSAASDTSGMSDPTSGAEESLAAPTDTAADAGTELFTINEDGGLGLGSDAQDAMNSLSPEYIVSILQGRIPGMERAELDGDVLNLYMGADATSSSGMVGCMVVDAVLGDRLEKTLVHLAGEVTEC